MSYLLIFCYGALQALTEFLPVSSSGHLALFPYFFDFKDPGLAFDLAMHVGTAFAVMAYFWRDILKIFSSRYLVNYIIATGTSVIIILIIKSFVETYGRSPFLIAVNLLIFGWVLYGCDLRKVTKKQRFLEAYFLRESFFIGLIQSLAIFPGVSRSGITISMGRWLGFGREQASTFSFILSIPLILAGAALKSREIIELQLPVDWGAMALGIFVSFSLGLVVIHFFFKLIKKINFIFFAYYRTLLALLIFLMIILTGSAS